MSEKISIAGLDKADVLAALYNTARPQGMGFLHYTPDPMTKEEAAELLKSGTYFDYVKGRVLKVNLAGDEFDPWGYNRDNGETAAELVIAVLRKDKNVNHPVMQMVHGVGRTIAAEEAKKMFENKE